MKLNEVKPLTIFLVPLPKRKSIPGFLDLQLTPQLDRRHLLNIHWIGEIMKISQVLIILTVFFALVSATRADSLAMRNGDHLSGTIVTSDAKNLTLKTDYAGEIKISWGSVKEASSDKSLYVVASGDKTVNGPRSSPLTDSALSRLWRYRFLSGLSTAQLRRREKK